MTRHLYGKQCGDGSYIFGGAAAGSPRVSWWYHGAGRPYHAAGDRRVHPAMAPSLAHALPRLVLDMLDSPRAWVPADPRAHTLTAARKSNHIKSNQIKSNQMHSPRRHAIEVLPALSDLPVARTWSGVMPFSADGAPLIGPCAGAPAGTYVLSGAAGAACMRRGLATEGRARRAGRERFHAGPDGRAAARGAD